MSCAKIKLWYAVTSATTPAVVRLLVRKILGGIEENK
jgi:hypothetical protein